MPRNTWSDPVAYDRQAHQLAELFKKNFAQFELTDSVVAAGLRQVASGSSVTKSWCKSLRQPLVTLDPEIGSLSIR